MNLMTKRVRIRHEAFFRRKGRKGEVYVSILQINFKEKIMRKIEFLSIWLGMWILCAEAQDVTVFVAEKGCDDAAGTLEAPFATLEKAMETVQKACAAKDVEYATIYFRGGRYFATKNRFFKNLDFSHLKTPLRISNWNDERVVILGSGRGEKSS